LHQAQCRWCRSRLYVPLRDTRLEVNPWRVTWRCAACQRRTRALIADELVPVLLQQDRCFGMAISMREVHDFEYADVDELSTAVAEELL